ncbi:DUF1350 family protein [Aphanothece sacrum]|uniref:DUF1350 domain-containing protein n=1 Tax=Aphanothece sacrum FPU1 TaxID=1920663 RepID=A0A401ILH0_APHSA|nr:DUF1350 family protein [Aphanothece sacrum]GBF82086.1 hypothetical protein AsFPU1_3512 [Aphanothece sacrum FPU1]GBF85020.1 hypothetical protein AsFPU3_2075 [Aphanothece sacrum FPU3]
MEWQEISGSFVLVPRNPVAIIHFLGGAFVGTAPNFTYRWLLEQLGKEGYGVVATPFVNTFDHLAIARSVLNRFENIIDRLQTNNIVGQGYLPIYGIGHSMGCKLHLLIGSLFSVQRSGNILISFNNYPVKRAIPFLEQIDVDNSLNLEFTPSPEETKLIITKSYDIRRNLLIKFSKDNIDETNILNPILQERFTNMVVLRTLSGNHLTPLGQEINWQAGEVFTPLDAVGQWVKQNFARDLYGLKNEILLWLNPTKNFL